jgi:uncharacterized membrane protein
LGATRKSRTVGLTRTQTSEPSKSIKGHREAPNNGAAHNVAAIIALEQDAITSRSRVERLSDGIAAHAGRSWFVIAHAVWFLSWILLNAGILPFIRPFDPYPYQFLTFIVSLEAIFLSLFILMSQNRSGRQADARSHLDLQINLLAEQESTKMLQMLQSLCQHHRLPVANDPEVETLKRPTEPAALLKELKEGLPDEC